MEGVSMPSDYPVESYIIRMYQSQDPETSRIQGIVESQNGHEHYSFSTAEELWSILSKHIKGYSASWLQHGQYRFH
jgi:hypothetical protein